MPIDEKDFIIAMKKQEKSIRAYIRGSGVYHPDDVDEIAQEVWVTTWRKLEKLSDINDFPKWASVITRYEILKFRQKKARDRLLLSDEVVELLLEEGEEHKVRDNMLDNLKNCIEKLTPSQKELIKTAYEPGVLIDQISESFGIKANAMYQKLWRIRKKLLYCMNQDKNPSPVEC